MSKKLKAILLLGVLTVFLAILLLGVLTVFLAMLVSCPGLVRSGDSFTDSYGDGWTSDIDSEGVRRLMSYKIDSPVLAHSRETLFLSLY